MDTPSSAPPSTPADKVALSYSGAVGSAASAGAAPGQKTDAPSEPSPGTTAIRSVPSAPAADPSAILDTDDGRDYEPGAPPAKLP